MNVLNLQQAATFLKIPRETLRNLASNKKLPAAKIGKSWIFIQEDLVDHLRSHYAFNCKTSQGDNMRGEIICHSVKEKTFGGFDLVTKENAYNNLLGLRTK